MTSRALDLSKTVHLHQRGLSRAHSPERSVELDPPRGGAREHLVCSMSRRGTCWDNAAAEVFFSTLKIELIHQERHLSRMQVRRGDSRACAWLLRRQFPSLAPVYVSPVAHGVMAQATRSEAQSVCPRKSRRPSVSSGEELGHQ